MSDKEAKKIFLKQAKPYLKRYDAEAKRKNIRNRVSTEFRASIENKTFFCSWVDAIRGRVEIHIPICFNLPAAWHEVKFSSMGDFAKFRALLET